MKYKKICGKTNAYMLNNDICEKFLNFKYKSEIFNMPMLLPLHRKKSTI